jgi:hypothetical protein
MKKNKIQYLVIIFLVFFVFIGEAQIQKENLKIGIGYGYGKANVFPFRQSDYSHEIYFYKVHINYLLKAKRKWFYEMQVEPSFNVVKHQLLNKWFVKPSDSNNYEELRELYTQERLIKEYVLNIGFIMRYALCTNFSLYGTVSVGPMISDAGTERLAKGFAFSDVLGAGISYMLGKTRLDFRYSTRHTSNLQMKIPNNGHNTTNMEFSVLFAL